MKVLLVDDEKKFVLMLAKRLELRGLQTEFAYTGAEAIARVEAGEKFDIAILDVKMPGIGGIELRRRLASLAPEMRFVFLTGHGTGIDALSSDAQDALYFAKPLQISDLVEALKQMANEAGCRDPA